MSLLGDERSRFEMLCFRKRQYSNHTNDNLHLAYDYCIILVQDLFYGFAHAILIDDQNWRSVNPR